MGSFDFPESVLLGYIYADALAAKGFPVRVLLDLGSRELVDPALMTGLIQLVPEYSGSALDFMSLGRRPAGGPPECRKRTDCLLGLKRVDGRVELARLPPRSVAYDWLRAQALIPPRGGGQ